MIRLFSISIFLLSSFFAFAQESGKDSSLKAAKEDFYLSVDARNQNIIMPPPNIGYKITLVKVFSADGKELISQNITDTEKSSYVDISKLLDGEYNVEAITADKVVYKTKIFISR